MTIQELFETVVNKLNSEKIKYAICGGVAANLYRDQLRLTADLDFLIDSINSELEYFENIIKSVNLKLYNLKLGDLRKSPMMGKKSTPTLIIAGKDPNNRLSCGLDFLTLNNLWAQDALNRAQNHIVNFGNLKCPTITPEDLFIAKLFAISDSNRAKDIDDLESILTNLTSLDLVYLSSKISEHKLIIPKDLEIKSPEALRILSKRNRNL